MKTLRLTTEEAAKSGFTHKAIISYAGGDFTAAATTQSYTLAVLAIGEVVRNAARRTVTQLAGGTVSACVAVLGDSGTANLYLTSKSVLAGATPIDYQAGDGAGFNQAGGTVYTTADTLVFKLTSTTDNIVSLTTGEIHVFWAMENLTAY